MIRGQIPFLLFSIAYYIYQCTRKVLVVRISTIISKIIALNVILVIYIFFNRRKTDTYYRICISVVEQLLYRRT